MPSLVIVARGKNTSTALHSQLSQLLGNRVEVTSYYLDGNIRSDLTGDLILIASQLALPDAFRFIRPGTPCIMARRSINYHEIDKLLSLPAGTEALLVNDAPSTAAETISLLQALGINHINYHPYYPGLPDYPRLPVAITPGEREIVPDCVTTTIDIKTRNIDFTTLVEILAKFSLLDEKANILSANYIKDIIGLAKKAREMANLNTRMASQLQTLINTVQDGIIALDEKSRVSVFNPAAEELLGVPQSQVVGRTIAGRTLSGLLSPLVAGGERESIAKVNDRQIIVSAAQVEDNAVPFGKVFILRDVTEIQRLEQELRRKSVAEQNHARYSFADIQGSSELIAATRDLAKKIARSDSPVLIQGESGTGKELFAQSIHNASVRKHGPFIAVNFAALTESLLESELFGYNEGAFTGARRGGQAGLFEQAHKGTIFLDEIGDAPLSFQVKLLRVLQEKQIRRIGGTQNIPIDVRVITASNKDLKDLISAGLFRKDLYYRLKVLSIMLPPLRERRQDIPVLAGSFFHRYAKRPAWSADEYFAHVMPCFAAYDWPGNIRELQNVVEYLLSTCTEAPPKPENLPEEFAASVSRPLPDSEENSLIEKIAAAIAAANQAGRPVGRRSLAARLGVPESRVRRSVAAMADQGLLSINRGSRGLSLARPPEPRS
jgi:transcriptional regulator with PAS, ATPase and Fis domain